MKAIYNLKTFIKALDEVSQNPSLAKSFLEDKRLSRAEKIILNGWLILRDGKTNEVIESLKNIDLRDDQFLIAQKTLLLGTALNNKGECDQAIIHLKHGLKTLENFDCLHQKVIALNNLFIASWNAKDKEEMDNTLKRFSTLDLSMEEHLIMYSQCQLNFECLLGQFEKAQNTLNKLKNLKDKMSENQKMNFCLDQFDFYIKTENFQKASDILEELKLCTKFYLTLNFKFMKELLAHLTSNSPIYLYENDFKGHPNLYYQMLVIKNLEMNELHMAEEAWNELMLINPKVYKFDFDYSGDKCLFSLCLDKNLNKKSLSVNLYASKEQTLLSMLLSSKVPLNKEFIYERIYQEKLQTKDDLKKLSQLISSLRKKVDGEIKTKKGCYYFINQKKIA